MPVLNWIGKEKVVNHHLDVPFYTLEHQYGFRADDVNDKSETYSGNMIIHGDNLTAMKALLPEFEGRINCAYFDPPYNTGKEEWRYNDNVNDPHIKKWINEVVGKEGEDLSRHDKWACMMYPRLKLIERLLAEDGKLVISIGYHEVDTLCRLCKEVFPSKQIVLVTVQTSGGKPAGGFNYLHEYLVYIVNNDFKPMPSSFWGGNDRSPFEGLTLSTYYKTNRPNQAYPIFINPDTEEIIDVGKSLDELMKEGLYTGEKEDFVYDYSVAPPESVKSGNYAVCWPITSKGKECVWRLQPKRLMADWKKGYIKVSKNQNANHPNRYSIQYLPAGVIKKVEKGILEVVGKEEKVPTLIFGENQTEGSSIPTIWNEKSFYTVHGTTLLKNLFPKDVDKFEYPKSKEYIKAVIDSISQDGDIILDPFAGSGTTAHAVAELNSEDDGNRQFILIELMDYAERITAERVKTAMTGYDFTGETKEILYSKKLTISNLPKAKALLDEALSIGEFYKNDYTKISKPTIADNCIRVIGTKEYTDRMEGLGGAFDFYELGKPLFVDGQLNNEVSEEKIRQFIYYTETRQPLHRERKTESWYLLDSWQRTGYYFYYERDKSTELTIDTLSIVTEKADQYIIYADVCRLPKEFMSEKHIIFKKIPRDIKRF